MSAEKEIKIVIADNHAFICEAIASYLPQILGQNFSIIATVGDGIALMELLKQTTPDIIILDLELPKLNGFEVLKKLNQERYKTIKTIVVSAQYNASYFKNLMLLGAASYLPKNCSSAQLLKEIHALIKKGYDIGQTVSRKILPDFLKAHDTHNQSKEKILTQREIEIIGLLADGLLYKEIADHLNIAINTVKFHMKNIYRKTQLKSIAAITKYAVKMGFTDINRSFNSKTDGDSLKK